MSSPESSNIINLVGKLADHDVSDIDLTNIPKIQKLVKRVLAAHGAVVYEDQNRNTTYFSIKGNVARKETEASLTDVIGTYLHNLDYFLPRSALTSHVSSWSMTAERITDIPKPFSTNPDTIAHLHFDVTKIIAGETPTWDYCMSLCGVNGPALMALIWALFTDYQIQQFAILIGAGKQSKGTIIRFISKLLSDKNYKAHVSLDAKSSRMPALLVGKRAAFFNDLNNTSVFMRAEIKSVIGGDAVVVDEKNQPAYSAVLDAIIFATSNKKLGTTSEYSLKRRCIQLNMLPNTTIIEGYEDKLWSERFAFLFKCREQFEKLYDKSSNIINCDYEDFDESAADYEEVFQELFDRCFIFDKDSTVPANEVSQLLQINFKNNNERIGHFKTFMETKYGIKTIRPDSGRLYSNLRLTGVQ